MESRKSPDAVTDEEVLALNPFMAEPFLHHIGFSDLKAPNPKGSLEKQPEFIENTKDAPLPEWLTHPFSEIAGGREMEGGLLAHPHSKDGRQLLSNKFQN